MVPEGYDHDFELPSGAFCTIFRRLAARWPEGVAQLYGGVLIPFADVADRPLDSLGDGFMAFRDATIRARCHRVGMFVDTDGESPLNVFLRGDAKWLHLDMVFEVEGSPFFSLVVHEAVGRGIAKALRTQPAPEWTTMNRAWHARTLDALRPPHVPGGILGRESAYFIALACWHRVRYENDPHLTYTQPPGRLTLVDGRLEFEADDAGPSPKTRPWGFTP